MGAWRSLPRGQRLLLLGLAALLVLVQIDQPYPAVARLHHLPTLGLILAAPFLLRRWPLSTASVACIAAFFALHTIGGRWTYTDVPYDDLARTLTGLTITETFGFARNHYDRIVHLAYGLLAVLPVREALLRHLRLGSRTALYVAVESVFAASLIYEVFEWLLTLGMAVEVADRYNGQQGDLWDAQKDMALAVFGALVAAALVMWRNRKEDRWRMK